MANLLQTLETEKLVLNNRLVFPPMATEKSNEGGKLGQGILDYYNEKSILFSYSSKFSPCKLLQIISAIRLLAAPSPYGFDA